MTTEQFIVEIIIPSGISHADTSALQKCEGRIIFLSSVRRRIALSDIDYKSFYTNGTEPDTLALLAAFRRRFAAVITRIMPGKITAAVLGIGPLISGLSLQNTSPFDLINGDSVCFLPPMLGGGIGDGRLKLDSISTELIFPMTIPGSIAREIISKVVALSLGAVVQTAQIQPRGVQRDTIPIHYNGRRYNITPSIQNLDAAESVARTLVLNMMFAISEGCMILFALIPHLLTLSGQDGYVNALVQLQSAARAAGQLMNMPRQIPQIQDGDRRFPIYETISWWLNMTTTLNESLRPREQVRVCVIEGPPTIKPGNMAPVIDNY
ncbi:UL18 [anatid alphaherpesvirus 1]|uniref:UL18 n=1 Tax=anatid alphaherpesvirus 1 TaxID=104388 RepID=G3GR23_9ALPH|nr:UL18 [Anatid alphaherpesvirus 1]AEN80107.1 UL18 [Anatid alphaherpesvirus 1]UEC79324.1 UL18 [Anatid alphaherpesvirus 1]